MGKLAHIPSPGEIGLPEKFSAWREGQEEAISVMITDPHRVIALCMPTGSGKSPVYTAASILSGEPTCIVTSSRSLQDQLLADFKSIGMVDLRGRSNYSCKMREGYSCEDGYAAGCQYRGTAACDCSKAEMKAAASSLVVTNYDKWVYAKGYGMGMSHFSRVVFDEAHQAYDAIGRIMQVVLNHKEIEETLGIPFPTGPATEDMKDWREWAQAAKLVADAEYIQAMARITGVKDPKRAWIKKANHLRNLVRRLGLIGTARPLEWIVDEIAEGYKFDPIRLGKYVESSLLLRIPKVIMVSATLRPKTLFQCGIAKQDYYFQEFPSTFDASRCPIYYVPTMRVDSRAPDLGLLWARLDQIAARRRDRKGAVHTVSFAKQQQIQECSRFYNSMLVNPQGEPVTSTVELFKSMGPGAILVSPSIGEGQDFVGDICRWQFLCKIPFEPPSKILKAREADDKEYRGYRAMQKMEQIFGRLMRSKEDWGENFIPDEHLDWFLPRYSHLASKAFHKFFRRAAVLPQPLNL